MMPGERWCRWHHRQHRPGALPRSAPSLSLSIPPAPHPPGGSQPHASRHPAAAPGPATLLAAQDACSAPGRNPGAPLLLVQVLDPGRCSRRRDQHPVLVSTAVLPREQHSAVRGEEPLVRHVLDGDPVSGAGRGDGEDTGPDRYGRYHCRRSTGVLQVGHRSCLSEKEFHRGRPTDQVEPPDSENPVLRSPHRNHPIVGGGPIRTPPSSYQVVASAPMGNRHAGLLILRPRHTNS